MSYDFLRVADPANPGVLFRVLNVVQGSWVEDEPEMRGTKQPAFDGTLVSTLRQAKRRFNGLIDFLSPQLIDDFRTFIAVTGAGDPLVAVKPMSVLAAGGNDGWNSAMRGVNMTCDIVVGRITAFEEHRPFVGNLGGTVFAVNVWRAEMSFRQI